jgi:Cu+-exporting ATPase
MSKQIVINGMTCGHCSSRVKNALEGVEGVGNVTVDLGAKTATFDIVNEISDDVLKNVIEEIGYEVVEVK